MSSIAPAANTIDWLSGAWSSVQSSSSSTGIAILDALNSKNGATAGVSTLDVGTVADAIASTMLNQINQKNYITGKVALKRILNETVAKRQAANSVNKVV
jgi:hypothetical protein